VIKFSSHIHIGDTFFQFAKWISIEKLGLNNSTELCTDGASNKKNENIPSNPNTPTH